MINAVSSDLELKEQLGSHPFAFVFCLRCLTRAYLRPLALRV